MTPTGSGSVEGAAGGRPTPPPASRSLRRTAIGVAGFAVVLLGLALLVVPIPGTSVAVLSLGLAILAREFEWARRLRDWASATVRRTWAGVRGRFGARRLVPATAHRS